jgi:hypothetical protein
MAICICTKSNMYLIGVYYAVSWRLVCCAQCRLRKPNCRRRHLVMFRRESGCSAYPRGHRPKRQACGKGRERTQGREVQEGQECIGLQMRTSLSLPHDTRTKRVGIRGDFVIAACKPGVRSMTADSQWAHRAIIRA